MKKKLLLTVTVFTLFAAPLAFAAEEITTSGTKKLRIASTGEEIGEKIQEHK